MEVCRNAQRNEVLAGSTDHCSGRGGSLQEVRSGMLYLGKWYTLISVICAEEEMRFSRNRIRCRMVWEALSLVHPGTKLRAIHVTRGHTGDKQR